MEGGWSLYRAASNSRGVDEDSFLGQSGGDAAAHPLLCVPTLFSGSPVFYTLLLELKTFIEMHPQIKFLDVTVQGQSFLHNQVDELMMIL